MYTRRRKIDFVGNSSSFMVISGQELKKGHKFKKYGKVKVNVLHKDKLSYPLAPAKSIA